MKVLLIHGAAETPELANDVRLCAANSLGPCRVRPDGDELFDVLKGSRAVESVSRFRQRGGGKLEACGNAPPGGEFVPLGEEEECRKRQDKIPPQSARRNTA